MTLPDRYKILWQAIRIANSSSRPPSTRLKALARLLAKAVAAESVSIYLADSSLQQFTAQITTRDNKSLQSCSLPFGSSAAGRCALSRKVISLPAASIHHEERHAGGEREMLLLPVGTGENVSGVVAIGLGQEASVTPVVRELLEQVALLVHGLFDRLRQEERSAAEMRKRLSLQKLNLSLDRLVDLRQLAETAVRTTLSISNADCVVLRMFPMMEAAQGVYTRCLKSSRSHLAMFLAAEESASGRVMGTSTPEFTASLPLSSPHAKSILTLPLRSGAATYGTLSFIGVFTCADDGSKVSYGMSGFYDEIAVTVAAAISDTVRIGEVLARCKGYADRLRELTFLYQISNTMLSTVQLNKLTHLILTALTSGQEYLFDRAMLFMINDRAKVMQGMLGITRETSQGIIRQWNERDESVARPDISDSDMMRQQDSPFCRYVRGTRLELDQRQNIIAQAVVEKNLVYVARPGREKRIPAGFIDRFGSSSIAVVPLIAHNGVVGVVIVDNSITGKSFAEDDLRLLRLFSRQAGIAIENALLYNRIEDTNRSLREAQDRLLQGEKLAAIGEMVAGLAHEMKNPLVSIGGFAGRLRKKFPAESTEWQQADTIVSEVERLERLLTDVLFFSRKTTICYSLCDLGKIVDDSITIVRQALEEKGIRIEKEILSKNTSLMGDAQQLKQVFINIFCNAHEVMNRGGNLRIEIAATSLRNERALAVRVSDTGGGIPLEVLHNIFNPFYTTKESGTGLGLPIAQRIVTNHGGKIEVSNRPGVGAEFVVILPLRS